MRWLIVAGAYVAIFHVLSFAVAWLAIRRLRRLTLLRTLTAFTLAWVSQPLVIALLGLSPASMPVWGLWAIAFAANALFLIVLGQSQRPQTPPAQVGNERPME